MAVHDLQEKLARPMHDAMPGHVIQLPIECDRPTWESECTVHVPHQRGTPRPRRGNPPRGLPYGHGRRLGVPRRLSPDARGTFHAPHMTTRTPSSTAVRPLQGMTTYPRRDAPVLPQAPGIVMCWNECSHCGVRCSRMAAQRAPSGGQRPAHARSRRGVALGRSSPSV
jgi:hypothetical protein